MVDESWTLESQFSGSGWIWKDYLNQDQFMGIRNQMRCVSSMHMELEMFLSNENYVTKLNMLIFWNGQQGYNFTNS